ncbi:MAG: hypothetical protein JO099_02845 [Acidobacteriia bacterium]|nr:hypothetical protein [Terriglobia bacterium]
MLLLEWLVTPAVRGTDQFPKVEMGAESTKLQASDLKEILHLMCAGTESAAPDIGCRICPEGTTTVGEQGFGLGIQLMLRGHFLGPNSDDLFVETSGCEPHARGYSGTMFFSHVSEGWFVSRGYSSGSPGACRAIRNREGLDGLLCWQEDTHADLMTGALEFHYEGGSNAKYDLFTSVTSNDRFQICADTGQPDTAREAKRFEEIDSDITGWKLTSAGEVSVQITATCRRYQTACSDAPFYQTAGADAVRTDVPPFRTFQVNYRFDGESFQLDADSRDAKREYDACIP